MHVSTRENRLCLPTNEPSVSSPGDIQNFLDATKIVNSYLESLKTRRGIYHSIEEYVAAYPIFTIKLTVKIPVEEKQIDFSSHLRF